MQNRQRWGGKHLLCEFPKDVCGVKKKKKKSSVFLSFRDAASWASWPLTWVTSFFFFVSLKELLLEGLIFHHRRQRWRRWRWFHLKSAPETRTLLKNRFILLYYQFFWFLLHFDVLYLRTYLPTAFSECIDKGIVIIVYSPKRPSARRAGPVNKAWDIREALWH